MEPGEGAGCAGSDRGRPGVSDLDERLGYLLERLRTVYDGIGHSSGRPYVYLVYPPEQERALRHLVDEHLSDDSALRFHHLDVGILTVASLSGQEERREQLLADPARAPGAAEGIVGLWARAVGGAIGSALQGATEPGRPVIVLRGLAALHPLSNPTALMEAMAEKESRDPATGAIVPVVILTPGVRPPSTSRTYLFLGREDLRFQFYRGEEA